MSATIQRFSSRRQRLDRAFLAPVLKGARAYRRIAGYFRSSIFELIGEEIAAIPDVRILCNSELDLADIAISKAAREAALKEKWNQIPIETEALLHRDHYRQLYTLLTQGNIQIRVVPKDRVFLHGKAGVIERADGSKTSFLGSVNETRSAFAANYEILWEDPSPEGVAWIEEEFAALWQDAYPLPDAIVVEIQRLAERVEVRFADLAPADLPAAALVEAPIYRGGEQLQPWQRTFVTLFLEHRERYGKARLLLADEVGLGKTLSLGASAMLAALLDDGPVLILCPSTLTLQWQVELQDRLGIPSGVWRSTRKVLGREYVSLWPHCERALPFVKGEKSPEDEREAWELIRNPLPPGEEDPLIASLRMQLGIEDQRFFYNAGVGSLDWPVQHLLRLFDGDFFKRNNPILRHTVLRRREILEQQGLLDRVGVDVHPDPVLGPGAYSGVPFVGLGLLTNDAFQRQIRHFWRSARHHRRRLDRRPRTA